MSVALKTEQLKIGYVGRGQSDVTLSTDLNLALHDGQLICLLGPNGIGKSTLMRTLSGIQPPLAGRVILAGMDVAHLRPRELAQHLSIVLTEQPNIGLLDGYGLVTLGRHPYTNWTGQLRAYDEAVVKWAIAAVSATDFASRSVRDLSDGQRQKLMIARALAQEATVMLLDEPTAFLDLPRRAEMMLLLRHLSRQTGRAILLSTHDLDLALRSADTLWLMSEQGIHVGTPEDLVLNGAFETAFEREGMLFDRASGAFQFTRDEGEPIVIQGEGILHTWTRRALERAKFSPIAHQDTDIPQVKILGDETHPIWRVIQHGKHTDHATLASLLSELRSQD